MKIPTYALSAALAALTPMLFPGSAEAALVSYLALDNATGLTLNNGAAITSGSQGKFGEALALDGVNDYAVVNSTPGVSGNAQRTVSAWVYQDTGSTNLRTPVALGANGTGTKWDLDIDNLSGGIEVGVGGGRNAGTGLTGLTGQWMLVTSTLPVAGGNIGTAKTYLNGTVTNAGTGSTAINTTNQAFYYLGVSANLNIQFLDGLVDDAAVWNEALTAGEIKGLYDVGMSVDLSYTAGDFDLLKQRHDAATGSTTIDSLEWTYASGLSGPAGLTSGAGGYTLVLDSGAGTGLTAIPEPSTALLAGLGLLAMLRRRSR
jgi:hypothetical protein